MRVKASIFLVTLALAILLLGTLAIMQRGSAGADGEECAALTSSTGTATPTDTSSNAEASVDNVVVTTDLAVVAEQGAVRLTHTVVIRLPASSPQVAALLQDPASDEYLDALISLLQPMESRPHGDWQDFEEVGPFANPSAVISIMSSAPRIQIAGGDATIVLPLAENSFAGYPNPDGVLTGPWLISPDGRDLVFTSEIDPDYGIPATTTWHVGICVAGLETTGIDPIPTSSDGAGRVAWTLPIDGRELPRNIEVRMRPDTGMALRLWLFAGDRRYLPVGWSYLTPVLLILVALALVPQTSLPRSALALARRKLQLVALASLGVAMTGVFTLALIPLRASIPATPGAKISSAGTTFLVAVVVTAVSLLILGRTWESAAIRPRLIANTFVHLLRQVPHVFRFILRKRRITRILDELLLVARQFARILQKHILLIPGAAMLLALIWWFGHDWILTQTWATDHLGVSRVERSWRERFWALPRLLAAASYASVLTSAIGIAWPTADRGGIRWTSALLFGVLGFVLCTPVWEWTTGLIPFWTVGGFLIASVLAIATLTIAPPEQSIASRYPVAWAIGMSLVAGAFLAAGALMWGWPRGQIAKWWVVGLFVVAVVGAFVLTTVTLRQTDPSLRAAKLEQRVWLIGAAVASGVILAIAGILAQWARSTYNRLDLLTRWGLDADPAANVSVLYHIDLRGNFLNFPLEFITPATDVLLLVGFAGVAGVLRAVATETQPTLFWPEDQWWIRWLVVLSFAALVVGYGGEALGYLVPLAFLLALLLAPLAMRLPLGTVDVSIDAKKGSLTPSRMSAAASNEGEPLRSAEPRHGSLGESRSPSATASDAGSGDTMALPTQDGTDDVAFGRGPRGNWWDNGVLALRRGACLATLPVAYFLYVLLSGQLEHILTNNAQFGAMVLVTGLAYELAFWLSAAFVLGSLYPYLWGTNGPLKGAVLASVYAGSHAVAALLLGRAGNYLWEVRSFQLLLYLGLLGVWLDYVTLQDKQISGRSLFEYYHIGKAKIVVGYLSPLLITLGVVIRQLYSGETRDAVNQIVTVLSQQIVNLPSP